MMSGYYLVSPCDCHGSSDYIIIKIDTHDIFGYFELYAYLKLVVKNNVLQSQTGSKATRIF